MLTSFEGVYRDGKLELVGRPPAELEGRVIVTFLGDSSVDLREKGIDESQAASLRARFAAAAEDWDRPEMDVYDAI